MTAKEWAAELEKRFFEMPLPGFVATPEELKPSPDPLLAAAEGVIREAVNDALERAAKVCDEAYMRYGEAVRECDTPVGHELLKGRATAAGICAVNIRAMKEPTP